MSEKWVDRCGNKACGRHDDCPYWNQAECGEFKPIEKPEFVKPEKAVEPATGSMTAKKITFQRGTVLQSVDQQTPLIFTRGFRVLLLGFGFGVVFTVVLWLLSLALWGLPCK